MKRLAIILVLAIFILASGCSYYKAKKAEKDAYEQLDQVQAQADQLQKQMAASQKGLDTMKEPVPSPTKQYEEEYNPDESPEVIRVGGDDGVGLKKLGTQYRDKTGAEKCDVDYPFSCMSYIAHDGMVDITVKYQAYKGMLKEVDMIFDGDTCDPSGVQIEPGDKQKFTCYTDEVGDQASGRLEIEYYETLVKAHQIKTGTVVANWE